jgi:hypothetical protein
MAVGGKAQIFDNDLLKLVFNATPIPQIADNAAVSALTALYFSLHTADPGIGGSQQTSEATYGSYARIPVPRSTLGFVVTGNAAVLAGPVAFPVPSAGAGELETFFAIGTVLSGTGKIMYRGPITPTITIVVGLAPTLTTGTTITEN